jgi:uncharacterized protein YbjT (DUF2867 family)
MLPAMTVRVLVTGGTGTLGRAVVGRLTDPARNDHEVRLLSRRPAPAAWSGAATWMTGDLVTGVGLAGALAGVDTIVHCATNGRRPSDDIAGTGRLVEAARRAGAPHLVYISIVGVDRVPLPYYKKKAATERVVEGSGLPWTVLRTTQFHDLVLTLLSLAAKLPVLLVPGGMSVQPVDVTEVAGRLVDLAAGPAVGRATDMGGPQVRTFDDLARAYLAAVGKRRPIKGVRLPGATARAYREGGHLTPEHADGKITFDEFVRARSGR